MNLTGAGLILYLTAVLLVAAISDIRFQKIPNLLTYSAMFIAIAYHTTMNGLSGLLFSLEGLALGIAFLLVFYLLGGMGAGDVKLMGAVGGLLGPKGVFEAFLFTAVIGGIYLIVLLTLYRYLMENKKKPKLCYGAAIALGTIFSVSNRFI